MVRQMKLNWNSWWPSLYKNKPLLAKFAVSILLVGLAFRLLFSRSNRFSDVAVTPFLENSRNSKPSVSLNFPENIDQIPRKGNAEKCDLFTGNWIRNPAGPSYTNETCYFIEDHQNCMKNGRPDSGYLYWKWKPRDCKLPQFDAQKFLERLRHKTWAFIGDSISRNHVQSFICLLSMEEQAVEVYHDEGYKSKRWHFALYNFTVSVIYSPFLAKAAIFEDINGVSSSVIKLYLDKLDPSWTEQYQNLDYMVLSSGKWFIKTAIYYEKDQILGCHDCHRENITELEYYFAYRKVLRNVFNFITESKHKGMVFYRTATPDHFENGEWFSGGSCKRTVPAKEGVFDVSEPIKVLRDVELEELERASTKASEKGVKLKIIDVMKLSLQRPDGHPGPYRHFYPFSKNNKEKIVNDCLHWCLPGPIDSWNDLLMEIMVNS